MTTLQILATIFAAGAATVLTRALPFLVFPTGEKPRAMCTTSGTPYPEPSLGCSLSIASKMSTS